MASALNRMYSLDIGIDLGTATTLVYVRGEGIIIAEPSVVAIQSGTRRTLAVGADAKRMLGRTPGDIVAIRPMKDGVIADFAVTQSMLAHFITKARVRWRWLPFARIRVVISVPSGITEVEKRAVVESAEQAGADKTFLIDEPMAAAIGSGLPVTEPGGSMIIDIGGGTTEVAVISLGGIVVCISERTAGDKMDEAIVQHIKRKYNLLIGERTAEEIKIRIGSAYELPEERTMEIKGRDLVAGLPRTITITSEEIREALAEPVSAIVNAVKSTLEKTPPELAADLVDKGIIMAGGGSQLKGLDTLLMQETGLNVQLADNPETAIVLGTGKTLDSIRILQNLNGFSHHR
ncbi:MAG TPA: rod shape-determining protein [Candidatus Sumerlaeota bacterium]|nr:MAG: Rod shape-determining protein MreB [candidate division BRC1 bacterium ADurb.BinA292]HOE96073.1 rod shape-determining protein [Candidatus Sumerlaeota bacterium]HOR27013.1 rod shape-determining protein [Candidatus Sumerlaeota bacterium]HPK03102.1 rod shape-determining protein [Candidatus Sumerlaeota bacterium]